MDDFQASVRAWVVNCFGPAIAGDVPERTWRFFEEATELVDYVFSRPKGEPGQEIGGVMVTLSALYGAINLKLAEESMKELLRIERPEVMRIIQEKQANKPETSPLPGTAG